MTTQPAIRPESELDGPLATERQLAKQLAAGHRATMMLYEQLEDFLSEARDSETTIDRTHALGWAKSLVGTTTRMQAMHHDGARCLLQVRNDGKRLVDVTHHVDRPRS